MKDFSLSRRGALASLVSAAAVARAQNTSPGDPAPAPIVIPGKRSMIVHNDRPEDLETPVACLNQWLTQTNRFFVRQHLPRPTVDEANFWLRITGRVAKEMPVSLLTYKRRRLPLCLPIASGCIKKVSRVAGRLRNRGS